MHPQNKHPFFQRSVTQESELALHLYYFQTKLNSELLRLISQAKHPFPNML